VSSVVDAIVEAFNRRDLAAFAAGYADDVAIEDARGAIVVAGKAALEARYAEMFARCPALRCEVVSRIELGAYVVDEEVVTGRAAEPERLVVLYHVAGGVVDHERIVR
jgi:hypothetical protein